MEEKRDTKDMKKSKQINEIKNEIRPEGRRNVVKNIQLLYKGGGQGAHAHVILVFTCSGFYVNVSGMHLWSHLFSQPLTITDPWVFHRVGWPIHLVPPWVTASHFLAGNRETEQKPTTFSSLLLFRVFLSFLFF